MDSMYVDRPATEVDVPYILAINILSLRFLNFTKLRVRGIK